MKAPELIEILRNFHDEEVCVYVGYNCYTIKKEKILIDKATKNIFITVNTDDVDNGDNG